MKYFIFNKDMDYRRGLSANLHMEAGTIRAESPVPGTPGIFLSRVLDSLEKETVWHRLVMEYSLEENTAVYLNVYSTDSPLEAGRAGASGAILTEDSLKVFSPFLRLSVRNPRDILLYKVKGRYLWFSLLIHGNGIASPVISNIRIYFPKDTWMKYLPEVYQGEKGEFLERYLSVFQTIYDDMEERIRSDAMHLDLQAAAPEFLEWLSGWLCAGNSHLWKPERLKAYLRPGAALYHSLGTPGALVRMVELYTGEQPYIREAGPEDNPHLFRLYIREHVISSSREYQALLRVIREGKPADMEVQVIALKPYVFLDQDTYLGINSVLNEYGEAVLDHNSSIPYAVLGGQML